ncbi:hypothetical protein HZ326_19023 [Fusarium oxysporum f. sp. albedinis]|nr:hypothetical protein HZ326_19023 [Fusarium oxysporum f. sp. albedinis]
MNASAPTVTIAFHFGRNAASVCLFTPMTIPLLPAPLGTKADGLTPKQPSDLVWKSCCIPWAAFNSENLTIISDSIHCTRYAALATPRVRKQ